MFKKYIFNYNKNCLFIYKKYLIYNNYVSIKKLA